jgi:hypothetical protein|tara:strand:+ start:836 stop:1558 length:723 start_codon:yes stop_codon:yes gene_type:complete
MEKIAELKNKKIAIIGLGASQIDYVIGVENSKQWDEVWGINSALSVFELDRVFMLDPVSRFLDTEDAGNQTEVMRRVLPNYTKPIYTCELDERVPALVEYPLEEVIQDQRCAYMNNTTAYALAFALWNEVGHIDLFGMDFSYRHNLHFAEAGRACLEFWICKCISSQITVGVSPRSSLLDQNVGLEERLYGYHRLSNPKIAMPDPQGEWVICDRSELASMVEKHNLETVEVPHAPEPYKG